MLDSTPETGASNKVPGETKRSITSRIPVWWLMSAAFHIVVLGWLAFFSPLRVIDLQKSSAEYTAGSDRIREVIEDVRERQADVLTFSVRNLQDILQELNDLEARKQGEFGKFSVEFAQDAPGIAAEAQELASKAQSDALATLKEAEAAVEKVRGTQLPEDFKALGAVQKNVENAQDRAGQPQDRALQALTMSDSSYESARQAQAQANAIQQQANKLELDANAQRENSEWRRASAQSKQREVDRANEGLTKLTNDLETARAAIRTNQMDLAQAQKDADQTQTNAITTKANTDQAKAEADTAKAEHDKLGSKDPNKKALKDAYTAAQAKASEARKLSDQARDLAGKMKREADSLQRKLDSAQASAQRTEERVKEQMARLEKAQTEAAQAKAVAEETEQKLAQAQAETKKLQAEAQAAQAQARLVLAKARLSASTNMLAGLTNLFEFPTNLQASMPNVYDMNLADLYQTAVATEGQLTEAYKRIRATELAMLRKIPLPRAMQLTEVAKVVRPNLKSALQATVTSGEDVPEAREAVQTAASEINAMVTLGTSLLEQAKGLDHSGSESAQGAGISLDWLTAQSQQLDTMEGLAAEDSDERAKDLSAAMQGNAGTGQGQGSGNGMAAAKLPAGGGGGMQAPGGQGRPGFGWAGAPVFPKKLNALPGRKIHAAATPSEWMYVDSWYIIGPFDNARRENIEKKFPPETVVDLNANYLGKENQPIRWEFVQSGRPAITPPFDGFFAEKKRQAYDEDYKARGLEYIIYYAYTELYFERACDLWIAVGSDDYSKVWIEDQLVWASGKQQKSWRVDEGLRKVHFRQGINRILYRVENGWRGTDFSLVICLR